MSINRIENPYVMRIEDTTVVNNHFSGNHKDWDDKTEFDSFKENFRVIIRQEQEKKCCFCKSYIKQRKQNADIEHFIPKSKHKRFTFHPENLAISCKRCNSVKSIHNPFDDSNIPNDSIENYPRSSEFYSLVHPHFDDYYVNIRIIDNVLIQAVTDKGWNTVVRCALYEPELAMDKAKEELFNSENIKDVFMRLMMDYDDDDMQERLLIILRNLNSI